MPDVIAYCGLPPIPGHLFARWNLDPLLIAALLLLGGAHVRFAPRPQRRLAAAGWLLAALLLVSPLCALSVSLFSARVGQHMLLALLAAPLVAAALPRRGRAPAWPIFASFAAFTAALWAWHLPGPYEATFRSDLVYWGMHATLFGSAVALWRELIQHPANRSLSVLALGLFTTVQMGLLGAVLTFSTRPLFSPHYLTTTAWGLDPLADQALGGLLMWVPGLLFFLVAAWRSLTMILPKARVAHG